MGIVAEVRKAGRIVIPRVYRKLYNLHEGDIVEFVITKVKHPDGTVVDLRDVAKEDIAIAETQEAVANAH